MQIETEGVVLRQVKTLRDRRMVLLFTKKYGKISVGANQTERSRNKASLALRPFTHGRYELYKTGDTYFLNGAESIQSFFRIGEDVDKYMAASYVLEFTERLVQEEQPAIPLFDLLLDYFRLSEGRPKKHETLLIAYLLKAIGIAGAAPQIRNCVKCGRSEAPGRFSIPEGGLICKSCLASAQQNEPLISIPEIGIMNIMNYILEHPMKQLRTLALDDEVSEKLMELLKQYISYHFSIDHLKSESFLGSDPSNTFK